MRATTTTTTDLSYATLLFPLIRSSQLLYGLANAQIPRVLMCLLQSCLYCGSAERTGDDTMTFSVKGKTMSVNEQEMIVKRQLGYVEEQKKSVTRKLESVNNGSRKRFAILGPLSPASWRRRSSFTISQKYSNTAPLLKSVNRRNDGDISQISRRRRRRIVSKLC